MKLIIVWLVLIRGIVFSVETGVLNVFTDLPKAVIKVDGLVVAQEAVVKLPLEVGEHYVQVELNNDLVYAEKVTIQANRSTTVISDHFVDIITKTPSRGAVDREAERLREYRGSLGVGFGTSSALSDVYLSAKWWAFKHIGGQLLLGGMHDGSDDRGLVGGRLFFSPADKIYEDQVLSGVIFLGGGQKTFVLNDDSNSGSTVSRGYNELGIIVEAFVGQLVKQLMIAKFAYGPKAKVDRKVVYDKNKDAVDVEETSSGNLLDGLSEIGVVILAQIGHASFEVSLVQFDGQTIDTNAALAIHFYF